MFVDYLDIPRLCMPHVSAADKGAEEAQGSAGPSEVLQRPWKKAITGTGGWGEISRVDLRGGCGSLGGDLRRLGRGGV